jgi:hypothetical protein
LKRRGCKNHLISTWDYHELNISLKQTHITKGTLVLNLNPPIALNCPQSGITTHYQKRMSFLTRSFQINENRHFNLRLAASPSV